MAAPKTITHPRVRLASRLISFAAMFATLAINMWWITVTAGNPTIVDRVAHDVITKPATSEELRSNVAEMIEATFASLDVDAGDVAAATSSGDSDDGEEALTLAERIAEQVLANPAVADAFADAMVVAHQIMVDGAQPALYELDQDLIRDVIVDAAVDAGVLTVAQEELAREQTMATAVTFDHVPDMSWLFNAIRATMFVTAGLAVYLAVAAFAVTVDRGGVLAHIGKVMIRLGLIATLIYFIIRGPLLDGRHSTWAELSVSMMTAASWLVLSVFGASAAVGVLLWKVGERKSTAKPWVSPTEKVVVSEWNADKPEGVANAAGLWLNELAGADHLTPPSAAQPASPPAPAAPASPAAPPTAPAHPADAVDEAPAAQAPAAGPQTGSPLPPPPPPLPAGTLGAPGVGLAPISDDDL